MDAKEIFLYSLLLILSQGLLLVLLVMYIAYFKMDAVFRGLSNSPDAMLRKKMMGKDPVSRWLAAMLVMPMLVFPGPFLKKGGLDFGDYERFPKGLRKLVVFVYLYLIALAVPFFALCIYGQYVGWLG